MNSSEEVSKSEIKYHGETFREVKYLNISVIIDSNGYYQASKFCKDTGKGFIDWLRLVRTTELMNMYSQKLGLPIENRLGEESHLALMTNRNGKFHQFKGYYIHPKLVHHLCEWCNLMYAFKVAEIMELLDEETKLRNISLDEKMNEMSHELEQLKKRNEELESENDDLIIKYDNMVHEKSVKTNIDTRYLRIYDITDYSEDDSL